jgi:hypothetical protein
MQVEFEAKVFLPKFSDIKNVMDGKEMPHVTSSDGTYYVKEGWAQIGTARVIITIDPKEKIIANRVAALHAELQTVRAENQRRENAIIDQISKLQAITFTA